MDYLTISTIMMALVGGIAGVLANSRKKTADSRPAKNRKPEPFRRDKAEWQYDAALRVYCDCMGKLPEELEESDIAVIWDNACNHCSVFLTWAIMRGFCGEVHLADEPDAVEKVRRREMTGTEFFITYCDYRLWREDFAESILPFVDDYYFARYLDTYSKTSREKLKKYPLTFGFSWEEYDVFEAVLDKDYRQWKFWKRMKFWKP